MACNILKVNYMSSVKYNIYDRIYIASQQQNQPLVAGLIHRQAHSFSLTHQPLLFIARREKPGNGKWRPESCRRRASMATLSLTNSASGDFHFAVWLVLLATPLFHISAAPLSRCRELLIANTSLKARRSLAAQQTDTISKSEHSGVNSAAAPSKRAESKDITADE